MWAPQLAGRATPVVKAPAGDSQELRRTEVRVGRSASLALLIRSVAVLALVFLTALRSPTAWADEGWVINQFDAAVGVQSDGSLRIVETILADFGSQQKHGIFRDIPVVYSYDQQNDRVYDLSVESVTDRNGQPQKYSVSQDGSLVSIKIGDPNRTVSGPQSYKITYRVRGALNAFPEHDELYWNVTGNWPVRMLQATSTVTLPGDSPIETACYQGAAGSTET